MCLLGKVIGLGVNATLGGAGLLGAGPGPRSRGITWQIGSCTQKGQSATVRFSSQLASAPVRRGMLVLLLAGVVVFPGVAERAGARSCQKASSGQCPARETVRWSRPLMGTWIAEDGVEGTVPGQGLAYVAIGHGIAVIGVGRTLRAYDARTGAVRWTTVLTGLPAGTAIVSVRAWDGMVSAGVAGGAAGAGQPPREDVLVRARNGRQMRMFPAAASGGVVSVGPRHAVVVGTRSVISYTYATGKVAWRVPTGTVDQAWRVDGRELYVSVSAQGELGTAPVTAVRQIDLANGAERLIQPPRKSFRGTLTAVLDGILVFSGADGLTMYSAATGRVTGERASAVFQGIDPVQHVLYADVAGGLVGIDPATGQNEPGTRVPGPPGTYGVLGGVALGLDPGASGQAWGYSIARRRVIWTSRSLPWPHYFVDLSGLAGSADAASGIVLLATCKQPGKAVPDSTLSGQDALTCLKPRLVAIGP